MSVKNSKRKDESKVVDGAHIYTAETEEEEKVDPKVVDSKRSKAFGGVETK